MSRGRTQSERGEPPRGIEQRDGDRQPVQSRNRAFAVAPGPCRLVAVIRRARIMPPAGACGSDSGGRTGCRAWSGRRWRRLWCSGLRLTRNGRLAAYWRQRLSACSWQRLSGFGFWKSRFRRLPLKRRLCGRRLTEDGRFAVYWRQWLSAGAWQRLTGFGFRKRRLRSLSLRSRLCRRRRRQRLTDDGRLAA